MPIIAVLLSLASWDAGIAEVRLPSPPAAVHPTKPLSRTETVAYRCPEGRRQFSLRYDGSGAVAFAGGVRNGRRVTPAEARRVTEALRKLDGILSVSPECGEKGDHIMAVGRRGKGFATVSIVWSATAIEASAPEPMAL